MSSYKIGLVGLPNAGKSTLFNFFTKQSVLVANYPFATIKPNVANMLLVDCRLQLLGQYWKSQKIIFSTIEVIDIAGLVKGASQGVGLGNEFLSHIREVDLICQVLRCFRDPDIIHVEKTVDSSRDYEIIQLELILADLQQIDRKLKKNKKNKVEENRLFELIKTELEKEKPINTFNWLSLAEKKIIKEYNFLTSKPMITIANYSNESDLLPLRDYVQKRQINFIPLAVKLESDLAELSNEERQELEIKLTDLSFLTSKIKELLNLKTFFTAGFKETKSWLAKEHWTARECAQLIHSDIKENFICVEVYNYNDWYNIFASCSNPIDLKKVLKIRKEGANYLIKDGDICHFCFGNN